MKKNITLALAAVLAAASLAACGSSSTPEATTAAATTAAATEAATEAASEAATEAAAETTAAAAEASDAIEPLAEPVDIKIGATPSPHAEILEAAKDDLAAAGVNIEIVTYNDYVQPNLATEQGEIQANYFQHQPYLDDFNAENKTSLVSVGKIHYEPFGLYGNGVEKLADVKEGASIIIPADDSNETRALLLLQQEGLIELPEGANAKDGVTTLDIKDDHGYKITTVQADTVAAQFANSDAGSLAVINGNYALAAGLDISKALAVEDASGDAAQTYANIVAVKSGNENLPKIQALIKALKSDDVKNFINEKYNGAVVAIF